MRQPRPGQGQGTYYLVLNRSCADLYEEIAKLFVGYPASRWCWTGGGGMIG
jgi:hypothetical protein